MLLPEHERFHKLSPKDVKLQGDKKHAMVFDIQRTTLHTGENVHVSVPVYDDDSREELNDRIGFAFSVIQDRLEQENLAVTWRSDREQEIRQANEVQKRNLAELQKQLKEVEKAARKSKWDAETLDAKKSEIQEKYKMAMDPILAKAEHARKELDAGKELPLEA